jgi:phosphatidylglycerol:prolipoprotein diacylglycerol transferase
VLEDLTFAFDPVVRLSETASVRLETIGLGIVVFVGLLLAARIGSVTPAVGAARTSRAVPGLRVDDLVFMVVGAVPGAIVGGRLGYVLAHLEFYRAHPGAILDPAQGGLSLTLAVPFGILTGAVIARLLGAPVGRWLHAIAVPLLFVLAAGKLVGVLGGSGQGLPTDVSWATSFVGAGPWGSLAADVPSHPSQVYEALAVGLGIVVLGVLSWLPILRRRNGATLFVALGWWAVARFVAATTWRDPVLVGPFRVEQMLLLAVLIAAFAGFVHRALASRPSIGPASVDAEVQPA